MRKGSVVAGNMLFPSTRMHIEMNGATLTDVVCAEAHNLTSQEPFKGNLDCDKIRGMIAEHGAANMSCVYVELALNASGGHPVSLANLKEVRAITASHHIPLFLDACRILENSFFIKQREGGFEQRSILEIVQETCALADACTMSALKDLLVSSGGLILTRDEAAYRKAAMQCFLDGAQLSGSAMELLATSLEDIFAAESYVAQRVDQVDYLWRRLERSVPLVHPAGGHAVFIDLDRFVAHLRPEEFPAEALAAFIYQSCGVRVTKGPPAAPSQAAKGIHLLRLAMPAHKYLRGHLDDVAEALLYAYANRKEIRGLKRIDDPTRSKYEPAHFSQR
jgi:tyrosine phenol-lyase